MAKASKVMNKMMNADKVKDPSILVKCKRCKTSKPETHFRFDRYEDNGLRYICLVCEEFSKHKRDCRYRKIETTLTRDEFYILKSQHCSYCDGATWTNEELKMNGIDRFDNDHGYHTWNCEPCCFTCNEFKRDKSAQFITQFWTNFNKVVERRKG
jgi:hypothetical protein